VVPAAGQRASSSPYSVLFRFGRLFKHRGGTFPATGLLAVNGTLYGTTQSGGAYNHGTIYSVTTAGFKRTVYSFGATSSDGAQPSSDLIALDGTLYGATYYGGSCDGGTVFSLSASGSEQVLHSFCGSDGQYPDGGLIAVGGTLYGTASYSASSTLGSGTVFSLATDGTFTVLHHFPQPLSYGDGYEPTGLLAVINGTLYGTTQAGGTTGSGTVYGITTTGKERLVYSFLGLKGSDGQGPMGGVTAANGTLYGTTFTGGEGTCFLSIGCGIVFGVTTKGVEQMIYRFDAESGGQNPVAAVRDIHGMLYGTTAWGGGGTCSFDTTRFVGCGTVYGLTTTGAETVLHAFAGGSDGANPKADVIEMNGALYGTTSEGGFAKKCHESFDNLDGGCGTVFTATP
jgi:uncharacterized repeat protein (TIGR03803 family)